MGCETCTWRLNPNECACGFPINESDPPCPGYSNEFCSECNLKPCRCHDLDDFIGGFEY